MPTPAADRQRDRELRRHPRHASARRHRAPPRSTRWSSTPRDAAVLVDFDGSLVTDRRRSRRRGRAARGTRRARGARRSGRSRRGRERAAGRVPARRARHRRRHLRRPVRAASAGTARGWSPTRGSSRTWRRSRRSRAAAERELPGRAASSARTASRWCCTGGSAPSSATGARPGRPGPPRRAGLELHPAKMARRAPPAGPDGQGRPWSRSCAPGSTPPRSPATTPATSPRSTRSTGSQATGAARHAVRIAVRSAEGAAELVGAGRRHGRRPARARRAARRARRRRSGVRLPELGLEPRRGRVGPARARGARPRAARSLGRIHHERLVQRGRGLHEVERLHGQARVVQLVVRAGLAVRGRARRRARFASGPSSATRLSPSRTGFTSSTSLRTRPASERA